MRQSRRAIARVNTVIRERERERTLSPGGLARSVGKLDAGETIFAAFRKRFGNEE